MPIKNRNIALVYIYGILTLGIYFIYWGISTKNEINDEFKTDIPTGWLLIIPIANIYWLYRYTEAFVTKVKGDDDTALWFILFWLVGIIMPWIVQSELNKLADDPSLLKIRKQGRRNNDRICQNCGRVIPLEANFCPYCNKKFESYL